MKNAMVGTGNNYHTSIVIHQPGRQETTNNLLNKKQSDFFCPSVSLLNNTNHGYNITQHNTTQHNKTQDNTDNTTRNNT